jgi:S1-C subfamily serine protease
MTAKSSLETGVGNGVHDGVKVNLTRCIFEGVLLIIGLGLFGCSDVAISADADIRRDATVTAVEQVLPSVVNIATETIIEYHDWYDDLLRRFYGARTPARRQKLIDLGSGVIIDEEGYVLTNFHVVRRAHRIQVRLWDGREYEAQALTATESSDVALMKIKGKPGERFKAIKLAADDDLLLERP